MVSFITGVYLSNFSPPNMAIFCCFNPIRTSYAFALSPLKCPVEDHMNFKVYALIGECYLNLRNPHSAIMIAGLFATRLKSLCVIYTKRFSYSLFICTHFIEFSQRRNIIIGSKFHFLKFEMRNSNSQNE